MRPPRPWGQEGARRRQGEDARLSGPHPRAHEARLFEREVREPARGRGGGGLPALVGRRGSIGATGRWAGACAVAGTCGGVAARAPDGAGAGAAAGAGECRRAASATAARARAFAAGSGWARRALWR